MGEYYEFLKMRYKIWWIIFFCLQGSIIILMASTFGAETWVSTENDAKIANPKWFDSDNNIYKGDSFSGKFFTCTESCDKSYAKLYVKWCDYYNDLEDKNFSEFYTNPYRSVCYLYYYLYLGSLLFALVEIAAIFSIIIWASGMICYINKINCIWLSYICSGFTWFFHYLALIGYGFVTRVNFSGDCKEFPDDGFSPKLCAGDGPGLMVFLAVIIPIVCVFFCVVACKLQVKHGFGGFDAIQVRDAIGNQVAPATIITSPIGQVFYFQPGYGSYMGQPEFPSAGRNSCNEDAGSIIVSQDSNRNIASINPAK